MKSFVTRYIGDIFFLVGLGLLGTGLYLFIPWVSFTVCGAVLIASGLMMGKSDDSQ